MKTKTILATAMLPLLTMGAEPIFQLDFNSNNVAPTIAKGSRSIMKPVKLDLVQNLPDGIIGKGLRDGSALPLQIAFSAKNNFTFPKGTVSFWCKAPVVKSEKNQRLIHVYAPDVGEKRVLIYTFFISQKGELIARNEISATRENTSVKIAASEIKPETFFKVDVTWDGKLLSIYKDGELQGDADLPSSYEKEAAIPRGWSSIFILRDFPSLNDDPASQVIIDEIKCFDAALDADTIRAAYEADLKKAKGN